MIDQQQEDHTVSIRAEQAVLGSLLANNDALDSIGDLDQSHFYRHDHRLIFEEIRRQVSAGQRADAITIFERLDGKVDDCLKYLAALRHSSMGSANIAYHAGIVSDKAAKRALLALADEMRELAGSHQSASVCVDLAASRLEALAQKRTAREPMRMDLMMVDYFDVLERRMSGAIAPVRTGYADVDSQLDGGLERGTLTVVAARPGMGKTAFGLGMVRNVSVDGVGLFFSMEMSRDQVNDRNASALGKIPLKWLRKPGDSAANTSNDSMHWAGLTAVVKKAQELKLYIDDETGLNMLDIRAKARKVRRQSGALDLIVIDQLSFITGGNSDKSYEVVGEHTRALIALGKELDCAVILLCQLNRKCEDRPNKRPIMADLAISGSIEQDAANIIFLYRDERYNPDTPDKGICEVNCDKLRQGQPGVVAMAYIGEQTRFEDLSYPWRPQEKEDKKYRGGGFK